MKYVILGLILLQLAGCTTSTPTETSQPGSIQTPAAASVSPTVSLTDSSG